MMRLRSLCGMSSAGLCVTVIPPDLIQASMLSRPLAQPHVVLAHLLALNIVVADPSIGTAPAGTVAEVRPVQTTSPLWALANESQRTFPAATLIEPKWNAACILK